MNIYVAKLFVRGTVTYEDPHCPTSWMGSHVYDITEEVETKGTCDVAAETIARALELIDEYDFKGLDFQLEDVEVTSISLDHYDEFEDEGVLDTDFEPLPEKDDYEPDPDERY